MTRDERNPVTDVRDVPPEHGDPYSFEPEPEHGAADAPEPELEALDLTAGERPDDYEDGEA